jgi:hypothetical protein
LKNEGAVPAEEAFRLQKIEVQPALPFAQTHAEAGAKGGRGKKASSDRTGFSRGETSTYLVRRLKRDFPKIAAALARGEFKSARAAGIVKEPTALDRIMKLLPQLTPEERAQVVEAAGGVMRPDGK